VLISFASVSSAQVVSLPDTLPFHHGQWAAQFGGGTNFASIGFLRFTTPAHAWVIDFRFDGGHQHFTTQSGDTLTVQGYSSSAVVSARLGRRFYQARGKAVASFQSVGALGGFTHHCAGSSSFFGNGCSNGWNAGVFGELGGAYLLTPRFSVGGSAAVSFSYQRTHSKDSSGVSGTNWAYDVSIQSLTFMAAIYF
jgi:hypothetical protein